jgi:hypothetical protein
LIPSPRAWGADRTVARLPANASAHKIREVMFERPSARRPKPKEIANPEFRAWLPISIRRISGFSPPWPELESVSFRGTHGGIQHLPPPGKD